MMHESVSSDDFENDWITRSMLVLLRGRLWLLLGVVVLAVVSWPLANRLEFDQSIETLYAADDPHLIDYVDSKRQFGGDELVIVAWPQANLFEGESFNLNKEVGRDIKEFADKLGEIPGIDSSSMQTAPAALAFPYERRRVAQMVEGMLLGSDRETTAVVARLKSEKDSPVPRAETFRRVRELAAAHEPPAVVVGEPIQIHEMFRLVEQDGHLLFLVSLVILAAILVVILQSVRWVVFPLVVVALTVRWTQAMFVVAGVKLSMVSSMLNSLVTLIGVATAMHLAMKYRELRRSYDPERALALAMSKLAVPLFWTTVTTAYGFGVIITSKVTPCRSFGLMMAAATMLVFVVVYVVVPFCVFGMSMLGASGKAGQQARLPGDIGSEASVSLTANEKIGHVENVSHESVAWQARRWRDWFGDPAAAPAEEQLLRGLSQIVHLADRHPRAVTMVTFAIVAWAGWGVTRIDVETDFSRNFRENSELVRSLNFVETRLGGAGTWEVNFPAPRELNDEYLDRVRKLAERLRSELLVTATDLRESESGEGHLTKVVSVTDGLDLIPKQIGIGFLSKSFSLEQRLEILDALPGGILPSLYNAESGRMRFLLRGLERQRSDKKLKLIERVQQIATDEWSHMASDGLPTNASSSSIEPRQIRTTGLFVLLSFLISSLMEDQVVSFVLSSVGIVVMMSVAFRSLRIGLISLVPNVFPIVMVVGTMGWFGLPINIATAMIASVSMGLTVDSSIVYLDDFLAGRRRGLAVRDALEATQAHVGKTLVFTNLALVAGFTVLTLSHFIPLVYFGLLVSVAMGGGLVGNLFLLPLLLRMFERESSTSSLNPSPSVPTV